MHERPQALRSEPPSGDRRAPKCSRGGAGWIPGQPTLGRARVRSLLPSESQENPGPWTGTGQSRCRTRPLSAPRALVPARALPPPSETVPIPPGREAEAGAPGPALCHSHPAPACTCPGPRTQGAEGLQGPFCGHVRSPLPARPPPHTNARCFCSPATQGSRRAAVGLRQQLLPPWAWAGPTSGPTSWTASPGGGARQEAPGPACRSEAAPGPEDKAPMSDLTLHPQAGHRRQQLSCHPFHRWGDRGPEGGRSEGSRGAPRPEKARLSGGQGSGEALEERRPQGLQATAAARPGQRFRPGRTQMPLRTPPRKCHTNTVAGSTQRAPGPPATGPLAKPQRTSRESRRGNWGLKGQRVRAAGHNQNAEGPTQAQKHHRSWAPSPPLRQQPGPSTRNPQARPAHAAAPAGSCVQEARSLTAGDTGQDFTHGP